MVLQISLKHLGVYYLVGSFFGISIFLLCIYRKNILIKNCPLNSKPRPLQPEHYKLIQLSWQLKANTNLSLTPPNPLHTKTAFKKREKRRIFKSPYHGVDISLLFTRPKHFIEIPRAERHPLRPSEYLQEVIYYDWPNTVLDVLTEASKAVPGDERGSGAVSVRPPSAPGGQSQHALIKRPNARLGVLPAIHHCYTN